ncbi:unnamed protein product [Trichogramma brassicae]|uniref:Uncharacterized protein n=1 Tax=Trichogramma brassicae TaxID=86971 RepID=A0A6H5ILP1_9HYME|nr:unnamed protein product [Trichogramma brassicae]
MASHRCVAPLLCITRHKLLIFQERTVIRELFVIYNDWNYADEAGFTHFHAACEFGCYGVVQRFLELGQLQDVDCLVSDKRAFPGCDPNLANKKGQTSLHFACSGFETIVDSNNDIETLKLLLRSGAIRIWPTNLD